MADTHEAPASIAGDDYLAKYPFLRDNGLSESIKTTLLQDSLQDNAATRSAPLERLKFWSSTPLVVSLIGLITIAANAVVSYSLNNQAASVSANQEERKFSYRIIETELGKTTDETERANVLLFLAKTGILQGLNVAELEKIATASGASAMPSIPATIGQSGLPNYREPVPGDVPGQTPAANKALKVAVNELNKNIEETASFGEVSKYWDALDSVLGDPALLPWNVAFVSWVIKQVGNPDGIALSAATYALWASGVERGIALSESDVPLPGDLIVLARDASGKTAILAGNPQPGRIGFVYKIAEGQVSYIAGNVRNALHIATAAPNDPALVGYLRLGKPKAPASE